jgi:manganese-transporting P-type ATPase
MSVIVNVEESRSSNNGDHKVLVKGAPEVIRGFLKEIPKNYDKCYLSYVKNGARVLALAYKNLPKMAPEQYVSIKREEAESELTFCGFLISECPLKPDTRRVINELTQSKHMVKMITGDN